MQFKIIEFLATVIIIYCLSLLFLTRYAKLEVVTSIKIIQSIMMTFGATSFIYSYRKFIQNTDEKIEAISQEFPDKWNNILESLQRDDSVSEEFKQWLLTGKSNDYLFYNLSTSDLTIIEILTSSIYQVWLKMVSIKLVSLNFTLEDYEKLFYSNKNSSEQLARNLNQIVGKLFNNPYVYKLVINEEKFYPTAFINYIRYCVKSFT